MLENEKENKRKLKARNATETHMETGTEQHEATNSGARLPKEKRKEN